MHLFVVEIGIMITLIGLNAKSQTRCGVLKRT